MAGAEENVLDQYPMLDALRTRAQEDPSFRTRLEEGLVLMFSELWRKLQATCHRRNFRISTVALSVPTQWRENFEIKYREIIVRAFGLAPEKVIFETEALSIAHYLLRQYSDLMILYGEPAYVLFLDFGGQSMVSQRHAAANLISNDEAHCCLYAESLYVLRRSQLGQP